MTLPDGYSDIPAGKIAAVVTHLEMTARPALRDDPPGAWTLRKADMPAEFYGATFSEVAWFDGATFAGSVKFRGAIFTSTVESHCSFLRSRVLSPDAEHVWPTGWCLVPDGSGGHTIVRANDAGRL